MFRTLVKTDAVEVETRLVPVRYFVMRTGRGLRRYSAEIQLADGGRVILDDDSMPKLEAKASRVAPATYYSRLLGKVPAA